MPCMRAACENPTSMEIVDCCNMGLKLRAELEVNVTALAMLADCRCLYDAFAPCGEDKQMRGLPCSKVG